MDTFIGTFLWFMSILSLSWLWNDLVHGYVDKLPNTLAEGKVSFRHKDANGAASAPCYFRLIE